MAMGRVKKKAMEAKGKGAKRSKGKEQCLKAKANANTHTSTHTSSKHEHFHHLPFWLVEHTHEQKYTNTHTQTHNDKEMQKEAKYARFFFSHAKIWSCCSKLESNKRVFKARCES